MTETPALDLVADRKVVKTARWNSLRSPLWLPRASGDRPAAQWPYLEGFAVAPRERG